MTTDTITAASRSAFAGGPRRERRPWAHPGVASEREHRAEQAYVSELTRAERSARLRDHASLAGSRSGR
jgi:hypothetical protein